MDQQRSLECPPDRERIWISSNLTLLGRRGALRILWELRGKPLTFRALLEAAETNPALLNTRLAELRSAGVLEHQEGGYRLTPSGKKLLAAMKPLYDWAELWRHGTDQH